MPCMTGVIIIIVIIIIIIIIIITIIITVTILIFIIYYYYYHYLFIDELKKKFLCQTHKNGKSYNIWTKTNSRKKGH